VKVLIATAGLILLAAGGLAQSAAAVEITGSWTGVIERHGSTVFSNGGTYETDTTARFLGTADVPPFQGSGLYWDADVAWSEQGTRTGSGGGCSWLASIDASGTSRTGLVQISREDDSSPWILFAQHHLNPMPWSGQICGDLPYFPQLNVATAEFSVSVPNLATTTVSGSENNGGLVTSWDLTRAPDDDCDGIPNGQDGTRGPACGGGGGGGDSGDLLRRKLVDCAYYVGLDLHECLFRLDCPSDGACEGRVKVTVSTRAMSGVRGRTAARGRGKKRITFGKARFSLAPGDDSQPVELRLTRKGKSFVKKATTGKRRKRKLKGTMTIKGTHPNKDGVKIKLSGLGS
jgi:hypothetical protein